MRNLFTILALLQIQPRFSFTEQPSVFSLAFALQQETVMRIDIEEKGKISKQICCVFLKTSLFFLISCSHKELKICRLVE